ncbi:MAG TPA: hypothetical protein VM121_06010 [Acidimicrobiales bacterium]|nr:hypothetical protein [Acidimicrobiales bacterium]
MFGSKRTIRRTWRRISAAAAIAAALVVAAPADAAPTRAGTAQANNARTTTWVAGAWQATPSLVPTGLGDLQACKDIPFMAFASLKGAFAGTWTEQSMKVEFCDTSQMPNHLYYRVSGVGTLKGLYLGDHTRGSLTWAGAWEGDAISGESTGRFDITDGRGDPTFKCSSGRLTFAGFTNFVTSFGGYSGAWAHGCGK